MKQLHLVPKLKSRKEHGGTLLIGKRRNQRPLSLKTPLHLVLKSDFAHGSRSLLRHRPLIQNVIAKARKRFFIRVYEVAIVSNHIHVIIRGRRRRDIQNFFRVVAGHIAQEILHEFPILARERRGAGGAPGGAPPNGKVRENENKFWQSRIYSRVVTWGREYLAVKKYVIQNALEALGVIPFKKRNKTRLQNQQSALKSPPVDRLRDYS